MIGVAHQIVCLCLTNCVCVRGENDCGGLSNCMFVSSNCVCVRGENDWDGPSNCVLESYKLRVRGENDWDGPSNCVFRSYKLRVCEGGE